MIRSVISSRTSSLFISKGQIMTIFPSNFASFYPFPIQTSFRFSSSTTTSQTQINNISTPSSLQINSQRQLLQQKFRSEFLNLCRSFVASWGDKSPNISTATIILDQITKHVDLANRSLGFNSSSNFDFFFISSKIGGGSVEADQELISNVKLIREVCEKSVHGNRNNGNDGENSKIGMVGDIEAMLMFSSLMHHILVREINCLKNSLTDETFSNNSDFRTRMLLHHSIAIANLLRKNCNIKCDSHLQAQRFTSSILVLLHFMSLKEFQRASIHLDAVVPSSAPETLNKNNQALTSCSSSLLPLFGKDRNKQDKNVSLLLGIISRDWIKSFENIQGVLHPEYVNGLHCLFLAGAEAWEREKLEKFPSKIHEKNNNNTGNNKNKQPSSSSSSSSSSTSANPTHHRLIFDHLLLLVMNLFRFNVPLTPKFTSSNDNTRPSTLRNSDNNNSFKNLASQHQMQVEDRSKIILARYLICTCSNFYSLQNRPSHKNNSNNNYHGKKQSEQEPNLEIQRRSELNERILISSPSYLARLGFLIGAANLMNPSLLRSISTMYFNYYLVPTGKKKQDSDAGNLRYGQNNKRSSFVLDEREAVSVKRSIGIMKHKLNSSSISQRKYSTREITTKELFELTSYLLCHPRGGREDDDKTNGSKLLAASNSSSNNSNTQNMSSISEDEIIEGNSEIENQQDNHLESSSSPSASSSSFPQIDSAKVVIMKQVDLKRASPTASWGLVVNGIGLISVPFHMMSKIRSGDNRESGVESESSFKNSFYEEIVKPTQDLGCKLRLMAIDNKPVKNLQDVKMRLENITKVRLTVCVIRS